MANSDGNPDVREVRVGQGFAVPEAKLFPADAAFLVRFPNAAPFLQSLRNIEQAISSGYQPDLSRYASRSNGKAIDEIADSIAEALGIRKIQSELASVEEEVEIYTPQPSEVIFDAVRHLIEIAGSKALPVVLKNMVDSLASGYAKGSLSGYKVKAYITGYLDACIGFLKGANSQEAIQRALRPLFVERGYGPRQEIIDTVLTYRGNFGSMRLENRPINEASFEYYGKPFEIDGLDPKKNYTISELEIGVLAIFESETREIAGMVDVHPHVFDYEDIKSSQTISLKSPENAMQARTGRESTQFKSDWQEFFSDYHTFFSDGYSVYLGPSFWANHFFLALDHPNANYIPFEAKYYLWRLLKDPDSQTARVVTDLLNTYQDPLIWVVEALEGDSELLVAFGDNIRRVLDKRHSAHGWSEDDARTVLQALLEHLSTTEKFAIDAASAILPPGEHDSQKFQERIDFFIPISRKLAREALMSLSKVSDLDELMSSVNYHGLAQYELKRSIFYLQALYGRGETKKEPFDRDTLNEIQEGFASYPHAEATYSMRVLSWLMHAVFNQSDVSVEERRNSLRAFMEFVVSLDVYSNEGARSYAGPAEFEAERLANALISLKQERKIPERATILFLGSGPATRVEGPSLDRYREMLGKRDEGLEIIALDMLPQSADRYPRAAFTQGNIENLPIAPGSVDVVILQGSVFNNMTDIGELMRYHQAVASVLKEKGILFHETGSSIPVRAINERYKRMNAYHKIYPQEPYGAIGLIEKYREFSDDPGFANAFIYEHPMMVVLARLVGLQILSPPLNPVEFERLYQKLQDPEYLASVSKSTPNAYLTPFTLADPDAVISGEDVNARVTYVYERKGPTDPSLSFLLAPAVDAKEKKAAGTRSS